MSRIKPISAMNQEEILMSSELSRMSEEKVVKAPIKPIRMMTLISPETGHRCSKSDQKRPAKKQPRMLTAKVPHGKAAPAKRCVRPINP